jgi:phytoene/squalene synthetase
MKKHSSQELFNKTAHLCSKLITQEYSTSFTLGIQTLASRYHDPIYAIYGFVRYADEIVDTFHGQNKEQLLTQFRTDTLAAIEQRISLNPVLHSFQLAVNTYQIPLDYIEAFIHSMAMDLKPQIYDQQNYERYIYGSAEVVGLMCLKVFCAQNERLFQQLYTPARHLGAAFQKVNFLRDIKSDYDDRGRVYFPNIDIRRFDKTNKQSIELDIQNDFNLAYEGITRLPKGSKLGVYLAYVYYLKLFHKIKLCSASTMLKQRIRIANQTKYLLLIKSYFRYRLNVL